jgi:hypothetical protein
VRQAFRIGGASIEPGERRLVDLPVSKLSNHTPVTLPVHVLHGSRPGPAMFVTAAIHGDELNGVEIIRRVLRVLRRATFRTLPASRWSHGSSGGGGITRWRISTGRSRFAERPAGREAGALAADRGSTGARSVSTHSAAVIA